MFDTSFFLMLPLLVFCATVFLYDYLFRRVPNNLLLIATAVQLGCFVILGNGLNGISWLSAFAGFAAGLVFFLPLYALRAMAAGDVKFFAVLGLLIGPTALLPVFLIASLMALVHAVVVYASRLEIARDLKLAMMWVMQRPLYQRMLEKRGNRVGIPYAAYLALAGAWMGVHGAGAVPGLI
ncbi:prepilin peptidase CpaA [Collimonas sp. OK607]|uniref:A24 family peptidase n=1 Tax=Collimonas sp. OK607 TaxID=1798194 RepID=UPI0008EA6943|nr:A24 family peptidase [Collimonas sp. OK607]SFA80632.1 prepilin peptidase CpaA [Collimonas sp. OK607]